jgi:protein-tyrosine phosphatase
VRSFFAQTFCNANRVSFIDRHQPAVSSPREFYFVIDTHCHVLPFLDDGARDWDAALAMARAAVDQGVKQCITTPHWTGLEGETENANSRREELRERLAQAGIDLKLHPGNEVILVPRLVEALKEGTARTLADSNYVLLETAQLEQGAYSHNALFQLQSNGYRIILAHPERVTSWQDSLKELRTLVERGCFLQVNAASLMGGFGNRAKKTAEELIRRRWVALLATDMHSTKSRPPLLGPALQRCEELIGAEPARRLVQANPARVLCNEMLPYPNVDEPERRRSIFSFPWFGRR